MKLNSHTNDTCLHIGKQELVFAQKTQIETLQWKGEKEEESFVVRKFQNIRIRDSDLVWLIPLVCE